MPSESSPPVLWPRVIGQRRVKQLLLSALRSGRLPHAYLFYGPEGVGKDATALELARILHCERGGEEACGLCSACVRMETMQHPDVHFVTALPAGKGEDSDDSPLDKLTLDDVKVVQAELAEKGRDPYHRVMIPRASGIKINSIREIRRQAPLSGSGRKRVFIVSRAETLLPVAAHTLLKTLEEPPPNCMLILTSANRDDLVPTIVSRCQQVRFDPLSEADIAAALVARDAVEPPHAALLARLSGGSYTRAQELIGDDLMKEREFVLDYVRRSVAGHHADVGRIIDAVTQEKDRARVVRFLHLLLLWFRDALVLARQGTIINVDQQEPLSRFLTRYPAANVPGVLADIDRSISLVERNVYIKLVLYALAGQIKSHIL